MIREMKQEELQPVSELLCESTRHLAAREGFSPEQIDGMIRDRCSPESLAVQWELYRIDVYAGSSDVLGMVTIRDNEIAKLYVRPANHRQGIGRALFRHAEELISAEHGEMFLGAFPSAVPFYEAMGMRMKEWKTITRDPMKGARQPIMVKAMR